MKKDFLKFKLLKNAMNELRGGVSAGHVENCSCAGGGKFQLIVNESVDLFATMDKRCSGGDWSCSPQK